LLFVVVSVLFVVLLKSFAIGSCFISFHIHWFHTGNNLSPQNLRVIPDQKELLPEISYASN
jgi:hypothetical protein